MNRPLTTPDRWSILSRFTQARIGLGRAGSSLPTNSLLDFSMAHARARDTIHTPLDVTKLHRELEDAGFSTLHVHSRAATRSEYLQRPDLGRRLTAESAELLQSKSSPDNVTEHRLTIVIADGLSSLAPAEHALPLLATLRPHLVQWQLDSIIIATQARVALADEIGALRHAEMTIILIGERPGLKSADSLGAYLTWRPRIGRTDAERNCISNIRPEGLSYERATEKLLYLLNGARTLGATGISLKDNSSLIARELS